jgi:periplasmic divalent cation tolerance protein
MSECVVVLITAPNKEKAEALGESLVANGLAACVNIVPAVTSIYTWEGELCKEQETLMIAKSTASLVPSLSEHVRRHHDYEVPEVISLPITDGLKAYLRWVEESCHKATSE